MKTIRGFLVAVMWLIAIVAFVDMLNAVSDSGTVDLGSIKALLGALILTVILAAAYIASAIDENFHRIGPPPPPMQAQPIQPPTQQQTHGGQ